METNNCAVDETAETTVTQNCSSSSTGFENVKNSIAEALHKAAGAIGEKTAGEDSRSCLARFGMQTLYDPDGVELFLCCMLLKFTPGRWSK
jgi:hypothetical protein